MHEKYDEFKSKYKDGYRCIHEQEGDDCTFTLRDFKNGKICSISSNDRMEIGEIHDFLDDLKKVQAKTGHDIICTGCESD
ncbi:MAG: hypothetical protein ACRCSG_04715 [Cellulosilyticaceae bacterium]